MDYIGEILSDDGREILLNTESLGKIYIPKSEIRSIIKISNIENIKHGEFRYTGPFTTRYSFTNNAHPVAKGENYSLINLYGPEVHFAISNSFSLGLMTTWIASPMILALKYSIPTKNPNLNFSLGTLMGTSGYINTFRGFMGLHWANFTIGDRLNNFTLSGGYGYIDLGLMTNSPGIYENVQPDETGRNLIQGPMASIAGIVKVGSKVSFVFDSMFMYLSGQSTNTDYHESASGYWDDVTGQWVNQQYTYTVTTVNEYYLTLMLMPGLRFQKSENTAFQFNLSGVALIGLNNIQTHSFPLPMCTWFFRF